MKPDLRQLVVALVSGPAQGVGLSAEGFLQQAGVSNGRDLSVELLENALDRQDPVDVEMGTILADVFGVDSRHSKLLTALIEADWHVKHEDIVALLGRLRRPDSIGALYRTTQIELPYLEYDDSRSLARTAIYALPSIPGSETDEALHRVMQSEHRDLRELAGELLSRREPP